MGFSAKCSFENACYNPLRNLKLNMTDFRLILLDHTTYVKSYNKKYFMSVLENLRFLHYLRAFQLYTKLLKIELLLKRWCLFLIILFFILFYMIFCSIYQINLADKKGTFCYASSHIMLIICMINKQIHFKLFVF